MTNTTKPCPRCVGESELINGKRASLRGLRHRKLYVPLNDSEALAQFLAIFPAALTYDTLSYVPQGEGLEPHPMFVSGLAMAKYGMWADDHEVGMPTEASALVWIGLALASALDLFVQGHPDLPETPQELALLLATSDHPEMQITATVRQLVGLP